MSISVSNVRLEELLALARNAEQKPWSTTPKAYSDSWMVIAHNGKELALINGYQFNGLANARYIAAANPSAFIEIVTELQKYRKKNFLDGETSPVEPSLLADERANGNAQERKSNKRRIGSLPAGIHRERLMQNLALGALWLALATFVALSLGEGI